MNSYVPGSAASFGLFISSAKHTKLWELIRDPNSGICILLCTPEKICQSDLLWTEIDKMHKDNRLGRFVIDEAHCAGQWGHDFRPDYAKLGKLKEHFPSIPIMAVTATSSDRVRDDVCEILRIKHDYSFFRSSFQHPNITYSVLPKPERKKEIIEMMVQFIKTKYPNDPGIVYTNTRTDADQVADALSNCEIIAEPYHSSIDAKTKKAVQKRWMRNDTQVIVGTNAFGLGINKPNVRFVLHHSMSKSLEEYYQESGRAGRDGNPSDCVLYYKPKDVINLLKTLDGISSKALFWPMVRYAQQSGNDRICKAILLTHVEAPNAPDVMKVVEEYEDTVTTLRDVGKHVKTVVQLLHMHREKEENFTMSMLVKAWRSTGASAAQCVKDNPPAKDGLATEDCERIIISLLLEKVFATKSSHICPSMKTIVYLILGEYGINMLSSENQKFWLSFKPNDVERKEAPIPNATQPTKAKTKVPSEGSPKSNPITKPAKLRRKKTTSTEIMELLTDDDHDKY